MGFFHYFTTRIQGYQKAQIRLEIVDKRLSVAHRLDNHYLRDQEKIDLAAFFKRLTESEKGSSSEII